MITSKRKDEIDVVSAMQHFSLYIEVWNNKWRTIERYITNIPEMDICNTDIISGYTSNTCVFVKQSSRDEQESKET